MEKLVKGEKKIFGVCSGIANYFGWDVTLVRIGTVVFACACGAGLLAYIFGAIIMPEE